MFLRASKILFASNFVCIWCQIWKNISRRGNKIIPVVEVILRSFHWWRMADRFEAEISAVSRNISRKKERFILRGSTDALRLKVGLRRATTETRKDCGYSCSEKINCAALVRPRITTDVYPFPAHVDATRFVHPVQKHLQLHIRYFTNREFFKHREWSYNHEDHRWTHDESVFIHSLVLMLFYD